MNYYKYVNDNFMTTRIWKKIYFMLLALQNAMLSSHIP